MQRPLRPWAGCALVMLTVALAAVPCPAAGPTSLPGDYPAVRVHAAVIPPHWDVAAIMEAARNKERLRGRDSSTMQYVVEVLRREPGHAEATAMRDRLLALRDLGKARADAEAGVPIAMYRMARRFYDGDGVPLDVATAVRWLRKAADAGDPAACSDLGAAHLYGKLGVPRDDAEALRWCRKAAEAGWPMGKVNLGFLYEQGRGVPKDWAVAARLFQEAADAGEPRATVNIGYMYETGRGVPRDLEKALAYHRRGSELNDAFAMKNLGLAYAKGLGVARDPAEAERWLTRAVEFADYGDTSIVLTVAWQYRAGTLDPAGRPNFTRAADCFRQAADGGDLEGMTMLGDAYLKGEGVAVDRVEGVRLVRRAAEAGHGRAMNNLAACYEEGIGVDQDRAEAERWGVRAAEARYPMAMKVRYRRALQRGSADDLAESVTWLRRLAEADDLESINQLGVAYSTGRGVDRDDAEAARWFRKGAEAGSVPAMSNLAFMYEKGTGVTRDPAEARRWLRAAAEKGDAFAKKWLAEHPE